MFSFAYGGFKGALIKLYAIRLSLANRLVTVMAGNFHFE
jgi:hypothetical protein